MPLAGRLGAVGWWMGDQSTFLIFRLLVPKFKSLRAEVTLVWGTSMLEETQAAACWWQWGKVGSAPPRGKNFGEFLQGIKSQLLHRGGTQNPWVEFLRIWNCEIV